MLAFLYMCACLSVGLTGTLAHASPDAVVWATDSVSKPESLGPMVNSVHDDLNPLISPDGKTLYISRKGAPENIGGQGQDIWVSQLQADGSWGKALNAGGPLNNEGLNMAYSISPDGSTMLVGGTFRNDGGDTTFVAISRRTASGWSTPQPLFIRDFRNLSKLGEYCLSNDGAVLLMAIKQADTEGDRDLYVSFRQSDGTFSTPKNIGSVVNTTGQEATPFLASDDVSLYFATDGRPGYGEFDVYVTRRLDSTWLNWSEPENLGSSINTADWDLSYTIPADGKYAYFVSYSNTIGSGDVFRVRLPEKVRPRPVVLLSGRVRNMKTKEPIAADIIYVNLATGVEVGRARSADGTGEYTITLPAGMDYGLRAESHGFAAISENVNLTSYAEYAEIERELDLIPIEKGAVIELKNIFFDRKKAILKPESTAELQQLIELLRNNPTLKIEVSGHTDAMGKDADNQQLSDDRARAVMNYVVANGGIDTTRIIARGYGETRPVASNDTDEGRAQNRRVEFTILEK